jgi:hypothetical protein
LIWHDVNADGLQQATEPPLANVTVTLLDVNGAVVATTQTDANGLWSLTSSRHSGLLPDTDYTLQLALNTDPALLAFQPTASSVGADDSLDSDFVVDATRSFAEHQFVSPSWGQTDLSLYVLCCLAFPLLSLTCCVVQSDTGFVRRFSIGDLVFLDSNGDGLQAAAEPGIAGVAMRLTRGGVLIATTSMVSIDSNRWRLRWYRRPTTRLASTARRAASLRCAKRCSATARNRSSTRICGASPMRATFSTRST